MAISTAFLSITPGSLVKVGDSRYKITAVLGLESVLAQNIDTHAVEHLRIDALRTFTSGEDSNVVSIGADIQNYSNEEWAIAQRRFEIIRPLLEDNFRTRAKTEEVAERAGVHPATVYEWMRAYTEGGHMAVLMPQPRGRKPGTKKLSEELERIIEAAIEKVYLSGQRHNPQDVIFEVETMCRHAKVDPPHPNTVRNRIRNLSHASTLRRRGQRDRARNLYEPIQGKFPGVDFPLAVVQIDHTEANIIVVDEEDRQPMGRPWITLAIDVFSRMVCGVYVSMEKPSAIAAGMCVSMAILPKGEYLSELDLPGDWPVWGVMRSLHVDNAKEFRGAMLVRACSDYAMDLQLRPVKLPHYGGHIERLMGTASNEIRKLPGTTFSNPSERKGYDSEKKSALTLREFEQHLVDYIVSVYHQRVHSELNMPPRRKWELGILGDATTPGIGVPSLPNDPMRIRLDFMPFIKRTVQPYGLVIDDIYYYYETLNKWINAVDPENSKLKRKFLIRRDPRNISQVYFFDPELESYFAIPYRNTLHPAISVWELRRAQQLLKEEGRKHFDEDMLFEAIARMRKRVEEAVHKTKSARRQKHRIDTTNKLAQKQTEVKPKSALASNNENRETGLERNDIFSEPVTPFDDIQEWI